MKYLFSTIFLFIFTLCLYAQNKERGTIYMGLYSGGTIIFYSKYITAPYYKDLHYYNITAYPKLGYSYKNVTLGVIGSYTSSRNTFERLESTWGYGYFAKYDFPKKIMSKSGKPRLQVFAEWRHVIQDGYYIFVPDLHMAKIHSQTTYLTAQGGVSLLLPKSFSLDFSMGLGAYNFLKDAQNSLSEKPFRFRPYGSTTFHYNLKL